jgi:hypothetical protein
MGVNLGRDKLPLSTESGQRAMAPAMLYCLPPVHVHRGHVVQVRDLASEALASCEQTGNVPVASQVLSVLGSPHRHW